MSAGTLVTSLGTEADASEENSWHMEDDAQAGQALKHMRELKVFQGRDDIPGPTE
jgi:hypothetical protein